MSRPIFLICPQLSYNIIRLGEKQTKHNPMINIEHIIEVTPIGKIELDYDAHSVIIKNSFKYKVYFYTIKGELSWYFDTLEAMEEWVKCFHLQYGDILKK